MLKRAGEEKRAHKASLMILKMKKVSSYFTSKCDLGEKFIGKNCYESFAYFNFV